MHPRACNTRPLNVPGFNGASPTPLIDRTVPHPIHNGLLNIHRHPPDDLVIQVISLLLNNTAQTKAMLPHLKGDHGHPKGKKAPMANLPSPVRIL